MDIAADELLDELARIDATLQLAVRRAGQGCGPEFERRLQAHLRRLRSMLGNGVATHIAFLGLGLPRLLPMVDGSALHYVAWFGPLLVAVVAKPLLDRRFAPNPRPAPATALAAG